MTRHHRKTRKRPPKPRGPLYYPSQQHAGPAGFGDTGAHVGPRH